MRGRQTSVRAEDESRTWLDRVRRRSATEPPEDSSGKSGWRRWNSMRPGQDERGSWFGRRSADSETVDDESGSWLSRARAKYGLGTLLVAAGVVLVLFPEPITSTVGMVMVGAGVLLWLAGLVR
ncbi:hypothetical protein [Natronosalvus caseinilyticus]|uniref:hypothetical protein n=1 Tax=Natronosalvus caseinilyticus TaxID=2953747 RepID=UPI0028ADABE1|nr:hypothetical protein [Natronosalvus caseinilyticus]